MTLSDLLQSVADCLTPETAERLIKLQIKDIDRKRLDDLARRANEGTLSPSEEAEYRETVEVIDFIAILQAQARRIVTGQAS